MRVRIEEKVSEDYRTEHAAEGLETRIEGGVFLTAGELEETEAEKGRVGGGIRRIEWRRPEWAEGEPEGPLEIRTRESCEMGEVRRATSVSWAGSGIPLEWSLLAPPPPAR